MKCRPLSNSTSFVAIPVLEMANLILKFVIFIHLFSAFINVWKSHIGYKGHGPEWTGFPTEYFQEPIFRDGLPITPLNLSDCKPIDCIRPHKYASDDKRAGKKGYLAIRCLTALSTVAKVSVWFDCIERTRDMGEPNVCSNCR